MMDDRDDNDDNVDGECKGDRDGPTCGGACLALQYRLAKLFSYLLLLKTKLSKIEGFKKLIELYYNYKITFFCLEHHYGPILKSKKF